MESGFWLQLGYTLGTIASVAVALYYKLKDSNKNMLTDALEEQKKYIELKKDLELLVVKLNNLDGLLGEERTLYRKLAEDIRKQLAELHEKINKHNQDFHSKKGF